MNVFLLHFYLRNMQVLCALSLAVCTAAVAQTEADSLNTLEQRVVRLEQQVQGLQNRLAELQQVQQPPVTANSNTMPDNTPQLTLKEWGYHKEQIKFNTFYALDLVLHNHYDKAIQDVDARVDFTDGLGRHLYSITMTQNLPIAAGETVTDEGSRENGRLLGQGHQMLKLKNLDINAQLVIRKIVFSDNTSLRFQH